MDLLLQLGRDPLVRRLVAGIGQPITFPPQLRRARGPLSLRVLNDAVAAVSALPNSALVPVLASVLARFGARVEWHGEPALQSAFQSGAEAWGEPVVVVPAASEAAAAPARLAAIVLDASGARARSDLDSVYHFLHSTVPRLSSGGRIVVLAEADPDETQTEPQIAAVRQALEGVVRSLSKEVGRKGVTCNLIKVAPGTGARAACVLRYLLSDRSSFVTGQPFRVTGLVPTAAASGYQSLALSGKVALVTGAARGIGAETARALQREGAHVVVLDHPSAADAGSALARALNGTFLACDLADAAASTSIVEFLQARFGRVDIVVHNAGITRDKTLARMPKEAWDAVLSVNFEALLRLNTDLLAASLLAEHGRIVLLSSVGGIAGNVGQTNYAAAKAGLIGYLRALAPRLAPRGITINAVAPGLIETQMTARMPAFVREAARRLSSLNQGGLPIDVAEAIVFFCQPEASGVSGSVLRVCGGALVGA